MSDTERESLSKRLANRSHYMRELERRSVADIEDLLEAIRLWSAHTRTWTEGADADAREAFAAIRQACRGTRTTRERIDTLARERPEVARRACLMLMVAVGNTIPDDDAGGAVAPHA